MSVQQQLCPGVFDGVKLGLEMRIFSVCQVQVCMDLCTCTQVCKHGTNESCKELALWTATPCLCCWRVNMGSEYGAGLPPTVQLSP